MSRGGPCICPTYPCPAYLHGAPRGEPMSDRPLLVAVVVRQLHSERRFTGDGYGWSVCAECRQAWPCATEQAIANALAIPDSADSTDVES